MGRSPTPLHVVWANNLGTSLRELVHKFRHKTLILVKLLMLQKKVSTALISVHWRADQADNALWISGRDALYIPILACLIDTRYDQPKGQKTALKH